MKVSIGASSMSVEDLAAIAAYQAQYPGDQVPAGGVSATWTAADQAVLESQPGYVAPGLNGFLQSNGQQIMALCAVAGLILASRR